MSIVKLISITNDAEQLMAYCARVSNPTNQNNDNYAKLLKVDVEILEEIGELCDPFNLEKETLQLSQEDLDLFEVVDTAEEAMEYIKSKLEENKPNF